MTSIKFPETDLVECVFAYRTTGLRAVDGTSTITLILPD